MIFVMYSASSPAVMESVSATVTAYFSCKRVMTYRLFRPAFFQDAIKLQHEAAGGDEGGDEITHRFREEHGEDLIRQELWQDQDERDQQDDLPEAGEQQADFRLAEGHEALLASDLCTEGEDAGHIDAERPGCIAAKLHIAGEDAGEELRLQHDDRPEQGCIAEAGGKLCGECFLHAVCIARTEVEADDRLTALTDALHRQCRQLADAGDDRHCADRDITAVTCEAGGEADGEQALGRQHHEGGDAETQARKDDLRVELHIRPAKVQKGLLSGQEAEDPDGTDRLTEHRGERRALHAHPQDEDENRIQDDVDDGTDDGCQHADFCEALGGDEGVHAEHDHHKDGAEDVDTGVGQCIGQGDRAGTEEAKQGRRECIKHDGQYEGEAHQDGEAVADDLLCRRMVLRTHGNRGAWCTAGTRQHGEGVDEHEDRREEADAGQCVRTDIRHMADVDTVDDVIEKVDDLGDDGRNRELGEQLRDAAAAHVLCFGLHHINLKSFLTRKMLGKRSHSWQAFPEHLTR